MKNVMFSIGIGAALGSSFATTFVKANNSLELMNENYKKLRVEELKNNNARTQTTKILEENIDKERGLRQQIIATNAERVATTNRIKLLNQEMKINNGGTKEQQKEYGKLQEKIIDLNKIYKDSKDARKNSVNKIDEEKKRLSELGSEYQKLTTKIKEAEIQKNRLEKINNIKNKSGTVSSVGTKALGVGAATLTTLGGAVKRSVNHESAFADVKKQFDFATKEEAEQFKNEIQKIITDEKLSISVDELYGAIANAGQAGIGKNEAASYVSTSTKMGIAFDMTGPDAAESMFKLKNSFALSHEELKKLLDQMNMLGNTTGANSKDITDYALRVGNIGKAAGFTEAQIAAIGATLMEQGQTSEVAATGFKNISLALTKGGSATKSQVKAYSKLGLDPEKISKDMQKDAQGTFNKILNKLSKLDKSELNSVVSELFGTEAMGSLSGLLANQNKMNVNIGNTGKKSLYEGSMQKEADARGGTTENNLKNLQARLDIITGQIGTALLPSINSIATAIGDVVNIISKFQQDNPVLFDNIVQGIFYAGAALLGFGGILKAISFGMSTYATGMGVIGKLIDIGFAQKVVTAVGTVSKVLMGFATANPYVMVAAGIVAAGYAIYKNWDSLKKMAISLWETVSKVFKSIKDFLTGDNVGEKVHEMSLGNDNFNSNASTFEEKEQKLTNVSETASQQNSLDPVNFVYSPRKSNIDFSNRDNVGEKVHEMSLGNDNFNSNFSTLAEKEQKLTSISKTVNQQSSSDQINFVYSPQITGKNTEQIQKVLKDDAALKQREFENMYNKMTRGKERVGYGR